VPSRALTLFRRSVDVQDIASNADPFRCDSVDRLHPLLLQPLNGVFHRLKALVEWPSHFATSPVTRSGCRERYDWVGLPGNFLSVRLGSFE
jgi:hypothetical protein